MLVSTNDVYNALVQSLQQAASLAKQYDQLSGSNISSLLKLTLPEKTTLPADGSPVWINGMSQPDARGFIMLKAVEDLRARLAASAKPATAKDIKKWYAIQSAWEEPTFHFSEEQKFNASWNCFNSRQSNGPFASDLFSSAWPAYEMSPAVDAMYNVGSAYPDAAAFPSDNLNWVGPRVADLPNIMDIWYKRFIGA